MAKPVKAALTYPTDSIVGTDLADLFTTDGTGDYLTTGGNDTVYALGGDDTVYAGAGDDVIDLGDGNDTYWDEAGNDTVDGGAGGDVFYDYGGSGSDTYNGGADWDVVYYYDDPANYTITEITETTTKGKHTTTTVVEVQVENLTTHEIDYLHDIEDIVFYQPPQPGAITTQGDFDFVQYDQTVTIDVLANDYIEGQPIGTGLTISAILDVQIDIDGVPGNDVDLIPDGADLSYFSDADGGILNDGSILTLNADGTLTWDPNGVYDVDTGATQGISFWYEVSDGLGGSEYGDVTFQVTYPAQAGGIDFETMALQYDPFIAEAFGYWFYSDGPNGDYTVVQLNTQTATIEERDPGAASFDYDGDGDFEFRVWDETGPSGHALNVHQTDVSPFQVLSFEVAGLDAGEDGTIYFADGNGNVVGQYTFTSADLDASHVLEFSNPMDISQFTIEAGNGDEFFIDNIMVA